MLNVRFYEEIEDARLRFAVIVARYQGRWVFCKHRQRDTYECPGGHREDGEPIDRTAGRELWEETGAVEYDMAPVCVYSVAEDGAETFGKLYFAQIHRLGPLPGLEIERIELFSALPDKWTYPDIQPQLLEKAEQMMKKGEIRNDH